MSIAHFVRGACVRMASFRSSQSGNVAVIFALASMPILSLVGGAVDYTRATQVQTRMQASLDSAILTGLRATGRETAAADTMMTTQAPMPGGTLTAVSFNLAGDQLAGQATMRFDTTFLGLLGMPTMDVTVKSTGIREKPAPTASGGPCILLLDPTANQSLLVNSGARIDAPQCEVHVRSTAAPAAIINAGTRLNVANVCIRGTNIIKNSPDPMPISTNCAASDDPYANKLPKPQVGSCTNTRQTYDPPNGGAAHVMPAGSVWCDLTFNGSPRIVFQPGLHIIKGRMIINAGSTIEGNGVTFYYPDINSEIRMNGSIRSTLSAPTSGTYANILMFEDGNTADRTQFIFNGSLGEELTGLIYLPRRNVTYNSTSTINASKIQMVFNTLIMNSTAWTFQPSTTPPGGSTQGTRTVRLIR